jgi:UDP-N-acetyl-D-mannosaminouronate:lipid I N-acetyl-D-mannosaminouronosyltransferase
MKNSLNTVIVNGFKIHLGNRENLINYALKTKGILLALNTEKIYSQNPLIKKLAQEGIGYPDGIGAVWACKRKGFFEARKIPGSELWLDIIGFSEGKKSIYIVGSTQNVIEETIIKLKSQFPKINIVGFRNGFFEDFEKVELFNIISRIKPEIIFVAQGSPRQENLMQELKERHLALYMGLGGSLDVYTDRIRRAPKIFQKVGLEWLYRSIKEPKRIRGQLVFFPYLFKLIFNRI